MGLVNLPPPSDGANPHPIARANLETVLNMEVVAVPGKDGTVDTKSKSEKDARESNLLGMPKPEGSGGSAPVKEMQELVKGNPWLNNGTILALSTALKEAASLNGEIRRSSREASREQMNMISSLGKEQAELRLQSELAQAKMMETEADGHTANGAIMVATAVMMAGAFAGPKIGARVRKGNDTNLQSLRQDRDNARAALNRVQGPKTKDGEAPTTPERDAAVKNLNDKQQAYDKRNERYSNTSNLSHTLTQIVQQGMGSVKEFVEADTDYKKADIQRRKATLEHMSKMAETYEKLAQKMMQTSDDDAKNAAEQLNKFLQALEQIISTNYKTFGIGVHG